MAPHRLLPFLALCSVLLTGLFVHDVISTKKYESACEMTWSWPVYSPVERDSLSGVPVLFVPGHMGSYKQARSLSRHLWDMDNTLFDVFALDFDEEPTGLNGNFITDQATYLNDVHVVALGVPYDDPPFPLDAEMSAVYERITLRRPRMTTWSESLYKAVDLESRELVSNPSARLSIAKEVLFGAGDAAGEGVDFTSNVTLHRGYVQDGYYPVFDESTAHEVSDGDRAHVISSGQGTDSLIVPATVAVEFSILYCYALGLLYALTKVFSLLQRLVVSPIVSVLSKVTEQLKLHRWMIIIFIHAAVQLLGHMSSFSSAKLLGLLVLSSFLIFVLYLLALGGSNDGTLDQQRMQRSLFAVMFMSIFPWNSRDFCDFCIRSCRLCGGGSGNFQEATKYKDFLEKSKVDLAMHSLVPMVFQICAAVQVTYGLHRAYLSFYLTPACVVVLIIYHLALRDPIEARRLKNNQRKKTTKKKKSASKSKSKTPTTSTTTTTTSSTINEPTTTRNKKKKKRKSGTSSTSSGSPLIEEVSASS
eukprot:jgi/Phyca11/534363/estExt2_fgenesh1_pg.C_PHYCAscaffold_230011